MLRRRPLRQARPRRLCGVCLSAYHTYRVQSCNATVKSKLWVRSRNWGEHGKHVPRHQCTPFGAALVWVRRTRHGAQNSARSPGQARPTCPSRHTGPWQTTHLRQCAQRTRLTIFQSNLAMVRKFHNAHATFPERSFHIPPIRGAVACGRCARRYAVHVAFTHGVQHRRVWLCHDRRETVPPLGCIRGNRRGGGGWGCLPAVLAVRWTDAYKKVRHSRGWRQGYAGLCVLT